MKNVLPIGLLFSVFGLLSCPLVQAAPFSFLVYGDSRSGSDCTGNASHIKLINRMQSEPADLVFHVGDMITGYDDTSNWLQNGQCPTAGSIGSFKNMIAPLTSKTPKAGLPTFFFPVIGNHDDSWGDTPPWYPDPFGNGICDAFPASLLQTLVPNHTQQTYFRDKTHGLNIADAQFDSLMCSKTDRSVYSTYMYYSFDYQNAHFVVLRVNSDYFDLLAGGSGCESSSNYSSCYNVHQLHWLQDDLAKAKANPAVKHIIALLHAPIYTTSDGHAGTTAGDALATEFSKYGVKMVFSGHNHIYERTVPIFTPVTGNPARNDQTGTTYVVTGGGGSAPHGFGGSAWFDVTRDGGIHYVRVTVSDTGVSAQAVRENGTVFDTFGAALPPAGSACDINNDGGTNVSDVQSCVNQAIGVYSCTTGDINKDGSCSVVDVQRVVNAALGGACL